MERGHVDGEGTTSTVSGQDKRVLWVVTIIKGGEHERGGEYPSCGPTQPLLGVVKIRLKTIVITVHICGKELGSPIDRLIWEVLWVQGTMILKI